MRRRMTKILLIAAFSCVGIGSVAQKPKSCESCDCAHWPWPKECSQCCGVSTGTIVSSDKNRIVIRKGDQKQTFKVTPQTKIDNSAQVGKDAKVYYRRVEEHLGVAAVVTVEHGTPKSETGPITQGPGSAVSINQQGGITVGTLIVPESPLPHVLSTQQPLAPGESIGTYLRMSTIGEEKEEVRKREQELRKNPGVLITASLDASLTGAEFVAECENPCATVEALAMGGQTSIGFREKNNVATVIFLSPATIPRGLEIKWEVRSVRDQPIRIKAIRVTKTE